jgi:lauroyl/myristoyl acyltransferase
VALIGTDLMYAAMLRLKPSRTAAAVAAMTAVVAGTAATHDIDRLARAHVAAQARGSELTWRPWEIERIPIRGLDRLERARASGRGLVISHSHLGPLAGWAALGREIRPLHHPVGDWAIHDPYPGYLGYQVEQRRRLFQRAGMELLPAIGSAFPLFKLLRKGGAVLLSFDAPGERRTDFLGKPVDLDDGTAQLATKTQALILPTALLPIGRRWEIEIHEPLDPGDFAGPEELHLALAAVHEELILRAPEHLEDPRRLWATATAAGWYEQ